MRQRKKTAHPVAAPVHRRLELARLLDFYLADSLTNDEVCDRILELMPEPRGDGGSLHWTLYWYLEDSFHTRRFRQWNKSKQAAQSELLNRAILFLRSDLAYVEPECDDTGGWYIYAVSLIASLGIMYLVFATYPYAEWRELVMDLVLLGVLFHAFTLLGDILYHRVYLKLRSLFIPEDEAKEYWPFASKADYLAHTPSERSHEPGHPGSA